MCRNLHDKVQEVFSSAAFDTLEVDLTPSDLDALVEIAKDSKCSAAVRELHFVRAETWPDSDDWSEAYEQEVIEQNYIERGSGAILLSRALNGFSNLKAVRIKPAMWVSEVTHCRSVRWQLLIWGTVSWQSPVHTIPLASWRRLCYKPRSHDFRGTQPLEHPH